MRIADIAEKATAAAGEHHLGDEPVAAVFIFADDSFLTIGDKSRDGEYVSEQLIGVAAQELRIHYEKAHRLKLVTGESK